MVPIREMTIFDYEQVFALWSRTTAMLLREADSKSDIARYIERNAGLSFVAVDKRQIVGAVLVGTDGRRGYLQHLAVDTEFRVRGIGRALVQSAIDALAKIGIDKTHLFVATNNRGAQEFYAKLGWHPRDEMRLYSFNASPNDDV